MNFFEKQTYNMKREKAVSEDDEPASKPTK
jgi:hypothetical protein